LIARQATERQHINNISQAISPILQILGNANSPSSEKKKMPSTPQSVKQRQIASSDATSPPPVLPTRCSYDAGHPLTPPAEPLESQDLMDNNADISQRTNERKSRLLSADEEDNRGDEALRSGDNGSRRWSPPTTPEPSISRSPRVKVLKFR
jgi:hypothetical protein